MGDELAKREEAAVARMGPPKGATIEVIVRYDGKEWLAAKGTVEQVNLHNELAETPGRYGPSRWHHSGRRDLTITLYDPPQLENPERKQIGD